MTTQNPTKVVGLENLEDTKVKKIKYFLWFKTEWWEVAKTDSLGNDIYITTERPIKNVYLNGTKLETK